MPFGALEIESEVKNRQFVSKIKKLKKEVQQKDEFIMELERQLEAKADYDDLKAELEEVKKENANLKRSNTMLKKNINK